MAPETGLWLMPDDMAGSAGRMIASYVTACQQAASVHSQNPAAAWLLAQFIYRRETDAFHYSNLVPGPASLRPMIEIIDQDDDAAEDDYGSMTVSQSDYDDPGPVVAMTTRTRDYHAVPGVPPGVSGGFSGSDSDD